MVNDGHADRLLCGGGQGIARPTYSWLESNRS